MHLIMNILQFMKAFIETHFGYCSLIWLFPGRKLNHRINKIHERAFRLVYKSPNATFEELLTMNETFSMHERRGI